MYIYNVTINIDDANHKEWLQWIEIYITEILSTQKFTSAKMTEVMVVDEVGRTYSVQFVANSKEELESYQQNHENDFRLKAYHKFGDKMMSFATELKFIKEFFASNVIN
jgi:hypothetical protein